MAGVPIYPAFQLADCVVRKPDIAKAMRKFNHNKKEMQTNIFKLIPYLIIVCLVIALSITQCQKQTIKQEVSSPKDSTAIFKQRIQSIQARGEALKTKLTNDSLKTSLALQALKIENKNLRKKIKELRPEVIRIADSIPVIDRWVDLTDSLDIVQESELDTMRAERIRNFKSFSAIISIKDQELQIFKEIDQHNTALNKDLRKQVKRERRRKTFYKVTTALGIVGVLYMAVKD